MEVSGIVIEIDGKKYAIEMEKAKELYNSLHNLFGSTTYVPWYIYQEPYRYNYPRYNEYKPWWEYQPSTAPSWGTWCSTDDTTVTTTSSNVFSMNSMEIENG